MLTRRFITAFCLTFLLVFVLFSLDCFADSAMGRFAREGEAAYKAGNYAAALNAWQSGLEEARQSGNSQHAGIFLYHLGLACQQLHRYEEALDYYRQALQVRSDTQGQGLILNNLGIAAEELGRSQDALDAYRQALSLAQQSGDPESEGRALANIGISYFHTGEHEAALEAFQQARARYRQLGRSDLEADVLNNIGDLYERRGRYQEALHNYRQAFSIQRQRQDLGAQGRILNNIGAISWHLGQYEDALSYYAMALEAKRKAGDRRGEAATLHNIAVLYWKQYEYEDALEFYQQALTLRRGLNDSRGQAGTLAGLGRLHVDEGRMPEARDAFGRALSIAQSLGDPQQQSFILLQTGKLHSALDETRQAYEAFSRSAELGERLNARAILWEALGGLAAAEVELEKIQQAAQHYEQAITHIESLRAEFRASDEYEALMEDKFEVYDEFIGLLSRLHLQFPGKGYDRKAFEIFERRQGRLFLEQMGQSGARHFAGVPEKIRQREEQLETQVERARHELTEELSRPQRQAGRTMELEQRLNAFQAEQRKLRSNLQTRYPAYYALRYPQPVGLDELRRNVLQPDETMLVYHVMPANTVVWVVGTRQTQMYVLPSGEYAIQQQVANMRSAMIPELAMTKAEALYNPVSAQDMPFVDAAYSLFSSLIPREVRVLLAQGAPLYIVPSGALYALPFEALLTRPAQGADAHFLLEDVVISYLSSASLLKTLRDSRSGSTRRDRYPLLAFAHPDYRQLSAQEAGTTRSLELETLMSQTGGKIPELPETETEARTIAALFQAPQKSHPLQLRQDASRANLFQLDNAGRLDDYQYLLFSLHGIIPGEVSHVDQPALILSDDLLLMSDVFGLSLNADMVMLSACNTGRGKYQRGEGVMGLTRAFMYAGTPTTTVTLWSVESLSAQELSVGMFFHLKRGLAPAHALRTVKLQLLRGGKKTEFRSPYFWAPFVIFGEGFF